MAGGGGLQAVAGAGGMQPLLSAFLASRGMSPQGPQSPVAHSPFMPMQGQRPQGMMGSPQYQASPAAQSQIQSLLSGAATNPFAGAGAVGGAAGASRTPGMLMAQSLIPTTKEGGAQGPVGGFFGGLMGGSNRSPIGDIAGALALGLPISDESWRAAGYGPGGSPLGG